MNYGKKNLWLVLLLPFQLMAQPFTKKEIAGWQLQAKRVNIIRDNWGIPHIYGKSDADAVFGLLYAQCEDDFNRVEMNYIEKLGRMSEVNGEKDLYNDLSIIEEQVEVDPEAMEVMTQRLDQLNRLLKKHQLPAVDGLIQLKEVLEKKAVDVVDLENQITSLTAEIATGESLLMAKAEAISAARKKVFPKFEGEITGVLAKLGIAMAQFRIECTRADQFSRDGIDKVRFLFSANKGIEMKELSHAASGGELSRLMLSIKSMISQQNLLPTIVFDEIDNGVSGEVAGKVGTILKKMGTRMQVIAITHLPQIAGKGDHHYWVYKTENKGNTTTFIKQLAGQERVVEIAKMLSNDIVTDSAVKTAHELLGN